jgi:AraC-like DNA-binding protein
MEQKNALLKEKLLKWLPSEGRIQTAVPDLHFFRHDKTGRVENCVFSPCVGFVVQGAKLSMIGGREYHYRENQCLVIAMDMPGVTQIIKATPKEPLLMAAIRLDRVILSGLLEETSVSETPITDAAFPQILHNTPPSSAGVSDITDEIAEALLRLVSLLDTPARIPILAPMIKKEIYYYLLSGAPGEYLRQLGTQGTISNQIAAAISWIRDHYDEPFKIEDLSARVNMAVSTFHRHFHYFTALSPLQFQKKLRLYEAQRLLLFGEKDVTSAALEVGYESITQFNREYKRFFGEPPYRDKVRKLAAEVGSF